MYLFHGTAADLVPSICQEGLFPSKRRNWTTIGKVPGHHNGVYLTNNEDTAKWYGLRAAVQSNHRQFAVITVDVPIHNLAPEENYIIKNQRLTKEENEGAIFAEEMTEAISRIEANKALWRESLEETNAVIHLGHVRPKQIVHHTTNNVEENFFYWFVEDTFTPDEFDAKLDAWIRCVYRHNASLWRDKLRKTNGNYTTRAGLWFEVVSRWD